MKEKIRLGFAQSLGISIACATLIPFVIVFMAVMGIALCLISPIAVLCGSRATYEPKP